MMTFKRIDRTLARAFVARTVFLYALWWILSHDAVQAPLAGAVFACLAAATSLAYSDGPTRWRPARLPRLLWYFARQSLLGGWDVARRAFAPSLPLAPDILRLELRLPTGAPTVVFAWLVSLTPGTASAALEERLLVVHALDTRMAVEAQLRDLERHVAALFAA
jgi:multicomponent Na+:H+ antiporter subunit E